MLEFLPKEVRDGLEAARRRDLKRRSRLRLHLGDAVLPILRFWDGGFSLDAATAPRLRGLVDVYEGSRHLYQCLIVASAVENGELVCEFKRATAAVDQPPLDFPRDPQAPRALLTRD